jgi:hypothetical protein
MALVAALAVLFETVGWLSGGVGNILYFFLSTTAVMASFMPVMMSEGGAGVSPPPVDVFGIGLPLSAMLRATEAAYPSLDFGNNSIGPILSAWAGPLQTFEWAGVAWTPAIIAGRLVWIGAAGFIALFAALFFDRFDPARRRPAPASQKAAKAPRKQAHPMRQNSAAAGSAATPVEAAALHPATRARLSLVRVALAELRLLAKGLRWWWILVAVALAVAGFLVPAGAARRYVLAFTWLWPVLAWSGLGAREARHHMTQLAFSAAHPLGRQLPATWLAGVVLAGLTGGGVALAMLRAGEGAGLLAWTAAVLFIPSLAVALAAWSGSGKLFEVIYLTLWYFGPMNQIVPQADFMGAAGPAAGTALAYLLAAFVLLGAAFLGRRRLISV